MLSVVHFLRSLFQTPQPGAHLPGECKSEDSQLPISPAEPEDQGWSQETDHEDFETLSHQSDSRSDTKSYPFESASDTEPLPGDLPAAGTDPEREASWVCPDVPATRPLPEKSSTPVPEPGPKEELDSSPGLKGETYGREFMVSAVVSGEEEAEHFGDSVAILERVSLLAGTPQHTRAHSQCATASLPPAKAVIAQGPGVFSAFSHQKSKSESCLGAPAICPFLLWCCELGRSWSQIHPRIRGPGRLPCRDSLHSTAPLGSRTEKGNTREDADWLLYQPCLDAPRRPSCLLHTSLCHTTPESVGDQGRARSGHRCVHTGTLTRARSIACFPLGYPTDPPRENSEKVGAHWKEGTEAERDPRTQNTLRLPPTHLPPLRPAPPCRTSLQNPYKTRGLSLKRALQDPPSAGLQQENQLGQDSRTCPGPSCVTSELGNVSADAVLAPASCKSKHSREHRPEQPRGVGLAPQASDGRDKQKQLQDISVEAGNRIRNHTSKHALGEERKLSTRARFPRRSSGGGTEVWDGALMGCSEEKDHPDAPEATVKSERVDISKEAGDAMVLDPNCRHNAGQGVSEGTASTVSPCGREDGECGVEPRGPRASPRVERTAGRASPGCKSPLILIAVEQKGLRAARRKVEPLAETRASEILEESPGTPGSTNFSPSVFPGAGQPKTFGNESGGSASPGLGMEDRAIPEPSEAAGPGRVLIPQAVFKERTADKAGFFSGKPCSQECAWSVRPAEQLPVENQSSGAGAGGENPALEAAPGPVVSAPLPGPWAESQRAEGAGDDGHGAAPSPEGRSEAQGNPDAAAGAHCVRAPRGKQDRDDDHERSDRSPGETAAPAPVEGIQSPAPGRAQSLRSPRRLRKATPKLLGLPKAPSRRSNQPSAADNAGEGPGGPGVVGAEERSPCPGVPSPAARPQAMGAAASLEEPGPVAQKLPGATSASGESGSRTSSGNADWSAAPGLVRPGSGGGAGRAEGGGKKTPGDLLSRRLASQSCKGGKRKTPEKTFRARLALAHKTLSNFFESKVLEKESPEECSPDSLKGEKENSRLRPSSWRTLLKSKGAAGPRRPALASLALAPEVQSPLGSSPSMTNSPGEEETTGSQSYIFRDHWAPQHSPSATLSSISLGSPDNRRKSEPAIKCSAPREGGQCRPSGDFPEKSRQTSPSSPGAQQLGMSRNLPSSSACCSAADGEGVPCKPMSPKPRSPRRPCALCRDLGCPAKATFISMVSLGIYNDVDNSSQAPERSKTRTSLLLSLQTLHQEDPKEENGKRGPRHGGLDAGSWAWDLPGGEVLSARRNHSPQEDPPDGKPSCTHGRRAPHTEQARSPLLTTGRVVWTCPLIFAEDAPRGAPSEPGTGPQYSHISLDDLWLEKMQRKQLEKQAQVERKTHRGTAHKDGVKCRRKMAFTSPESLTLPRRNPPFSKSAPMGLNHMGWPADVPDPGSQASHHLPSKAIDAQDKFPMSSCSRDTVFSADGEYPLHSSFMPIT